MSFVLTDNVPITDANALIAFSIKDPQVSGSTSLTYNIFLNPQIPTPGIDGISIENPEVSSDGLIETSMTDNDKGVNMSALLSFNGNYSQSPNAVT
jgi:hypothetical protein